MCLLACLLASVPACVTITHVTTKILCAGWTFNPSTYSRCRPLATAGGVGTLICCSSSKCGSFRRYSTLLHRTGTLE
ncbi:hypothetical protein BZA05DRAFT_399896 [Tricharina praecox]|uniref:uncharacterized protein n=1 Tax=Tricharina praecox TaxID=43433 RepID=UPI002220A676|nr:uncharacterized protein BZA05DRAFT_399896 [Tricharina praecox]KAI5850668.1 hypothetical protein BZA05DRAFT_399896 [Tricharina praecox]